MSDLPSIMRRIGETDDDLRLRIHQMEDRKHQKNLKYLLVRFKIKSAKALPGLTLSFADMTIRKPGAYTKVSNVGS